MKLPLILVKRSLLAGLVLFFTAHSFFAQQYNFKNYSVESGLPYVQIFAMYQDQDGYLWSGGYGGLSKFDGKKFYSYSPKNGLANHWVNAIIQDTDKCIAVGTIQGLSVLKKGKIYNFYVKDGLPSDNVTSFCLDRSGLLWIGTTKGLCYYNGKHIVKYAPAENLNVTCLYGSADNNDVYVGTSRALYRIFDKSLGEQGMRTDIDSAYISAISQCPLTQQIYIGTHNGLYSMDLASHKISRYHISNGLLDEEINAVLCQNNGTVWIGSKTGLISFNGKEFSYYTINTDYNSNHVRSLLLDYEENLWVGTHNGLYKYRGKGFTVYDRDEGLGGAFIYQIDRDRENNLWVTTEANGVYKYANGYFKNYSTKEGLQDIKAVCVLPMDDGSVWFGTDNGISKIHGEKVENVPKGKKESFLQEPPINCFYRDSKGQVWVGGHNGLCCMQKTGETYRTTYYTLPVKAKDYDVWTILEDDDGTIWAGTYLAGLYKLENGAFSIEPVDPVESVLDMDKDRFGNIYAATLNGVLVFNPRKQSHKLISEKDGLSSELVYTIKLTRDKKHLWAGTNQGINRIDIEKLNRGNMDIVSFGKAEGFRGIECNTHGIYEDTDHAIWFGTVNGLIKYSSDEFIENTSPSKTTISAIKLAYQDTNLANGSVLPFSMNNITFEFTGICLTNPDKVLYTYKLEGFDKKWSPPSPDNFMRYSNLPEGKYTFAVKSCNNEGVWNADPTTFMFTIRPPFYRTWWFMFLSAVFTMGMVTLVFRLRLRQIKRKQKAEFEQQVEISKAELKALRAQMNPHFVFNSLNSIQHFILTSKGEEAVKYLGKFAKLIRTILNNSEKPTVTIDEDLDAVKLYLELERMRFDNKFDYDIQIDEAIDPDFDEIPPMLMQPYLENAILHGINPMEGTGHIHIEIRHRAHYMHCIITDNGIGREKAQEMKSLRPLSKYKSLGMKITSDRVRLLNEMNHSSLSVNVIDLYDGDKRPAGTRVELFIPYIK